MTRVVVVLLLVAAVGAYVLRQVTESGGAKVSEASPMPSGPIPADSRLATFGGGCFWCAEAVFRRVDGVLSVESGFSGGSVVNPTYEDVCGGETGHAEVIQVRYDPKKVPYEDLL